jgi:hypothetical protein
MKKTIIFALCVWFISLNAIHAQKISFNNQKISIPYTQFPKETSIAAKSTYQVVFDISTSNFHKLQLKQTEVTDMFQMNGYVYKADAADFTYQIKVDNPVVVESKTESVKKGESVEYVANIKIAVPTTISLIDNATGKSVYSTVISTSKKPTEYKSRSNASKSSIDKLLAKTAGGMHPSVAPVYKKALFDAVKKMKAQYTFQTRSYRATYYSVNEKKAPQLSAFNKQLNTVITSLGEIKANQSLESVKAKVLPTLKIWEQELAKVKGEDKYHNKLRFLYLYSLSSTYFVLEEMTSAKQFCGEKYNGTFRYLSELKPILTSSENKEKSLAGSFNSHHFARAEMETTQKYLYTAIAEQAPPQKAGLKDMGKEFKEIGNAFAEVGTSTVELGKEIKEFKESLEKPVLGDSTYCHTSRFSTIRFEANGKKYVFGENKLEDGTGNPSPKFEAYTVYLQRKPKDIPVYKEIEFFSMYLSMYTANNSILVDEIAKELKAYSGQSISDITIRKKPSGDMVPNADGTSAKLIEPSAYNKNLSFDLKFRFANTETNKDILYRSKNGDRLTYQLDNIRPIVLIHYDGKGAVSKYSQGYMVQITIPTVTLEQYNPITDKPYMKYTGKKLEITDLEISVLLTDVERLKKM